MKNRKHETKNCPRCNTEFECKSGSVLLCQCQTIVLSTEQLDYITSLYADCLCISCLHALRTEYNIQQHVLIIQKYSR
ncbi:cysteine-rich CWC family protein [Kaarinaea lacus]